MFRVLPFGLASACYVFTKLLRPLVRKWRSAGLKAIVYIDDGICSASSFEASVSASEAITSDLRNAGFVLNKEKSHLAPMQVGRWLGFIIDLQEGMFRVPEDRIAKLKQSITLVPENDPVSMRLLASVVGQIVAMGIAVGPVARLRTRALYGVVNSRLAWSDYLELSEEAREELVFWHQAINDLNGQPIWFSASATRVAYSDASGTGYGGYVVEIGQEVSHGHWSPDEAARSSTWRELKALERVLLSFSTRLSGHKVKWFSDNQNVVHIVHKGSRKKHLQGGAMSIYAICLKASVRLEVEWIPRSANEKADYYRKVVDYVD